MRLQSIKLSGFKSFVDATTLRFPSSMTAILGPNGCGKSNVIDAIRWVMGESSARQLRGDAMSDVIFAGTTNRKAVGLASVELHFENTLGKLGGAYNSYSELAIRRQVTRDGGSEYFLNGSRCRRRDITDIFLGTGLGPRSYAVIEQGMISRLVEAKPDELRVFIEEAAGVSRYNARRRETAQHLEHTRQNLLRLDDVVSELDSQMRQLKRQSSAVDTYRKLEAQSYLTQYKLYQLEQQQTVAKQAVYTESLTHLSQKFRQIREHRHDIEQQLEEDGTALSTLLAQAEPVQQAWQQAERDLSEQTTKLQQLTQTVQQLQQQLSNLQTEQAQLAIQHAQDEAQQQRLQQDINQLTPLLEQLNQDDYQQNTQLIELEAQWQRVQQDLQALHQANVQDENAHARVQHSIETIKRNQIRLDSQVKQLEEQLHKLADSHIIDTREDVVWQLENVQLEVADTVQKRKNIEASLTELTAQQRTQQENLDVLTRSRNAWSGELKALELLLDSSPKAHTSSVTSTIKTLLLVDVLDLSDAGKQHLPLIEQFLGAWLTASVELVSTTHIPHAGDALVYDMSAPMNATYPVGVQPFSDWIKTPKLSLWQGVGVVANLEEARPYCQNLQQGQSLLTCDGFWLGVDWIKNLSPSDVNRAEQGLLLQRLRRETLLQQLTDSNAEYTAMQDVCAHVSTQLTELRTLLTTNSSLEKELLQQQQKLAVELAKLDSTINAAQTQSTQYKIQVEHLKENIQEDAEQLAELQLDAASIIMRMDIRKPELEQKQQFLDTLKHEREQARQLNLQRTQQKQKLVIDTQTARARYEALLQTIQRNTIRLEDIDVRVQQLQQQITNEVEQRPILEQRIEDCEAQAELARMQWQKRQTKLETLQTSQQSLAQSRAQLQQEEDETRDALERERLAWQSCKATLEQLSEMLENIPRDKLPADNLIMFDALTVEELSGKLEQFKQQMMRLGELNLAAPTALAEVSGRHNELLHQIEDLQQTIAQLEDAMHSIDQETRTLFMQTFERINTELQQLFPKVFGGGQASLALDGDWQSGVKFMAQPPGKKNSSITLLSGGEKALTALALVFSIFRLNPAPFCLLDEVDAPLDDANVARFCNLVKELSTQVQFVYITHNKLAMTMAQDLLGVTMPELGVSKLVSVSLDEAETFVAS